MKITTITRTVSGDSFDNVSATAQVDDDDAIEVIMKLDTILKHSLDEIALQGQVMHRQEEEKHNTVSLLERALQYAKNTEIPF